jgi:hypothetical protein
MKERYTIPFERFMEASRWTIFRQPLPANEKMISRE